jgi:glycosyltransferase involved in cell wall biosynthesis
MILVNCASIVQGGGVQASAGFIRHIETNETPGLQWHVACSKPLADELAMLGSDVMDQSRYTIITPQPAHDSASRALLAGLVPSIRAEAMFTFFGPAYVRPAVPHLCGVADGWVTHSTRLAYSSLPSLHAKARMALVCLYKGLWFRGADAWWVEAECARAGLKRRYFIDENRVHVVPNTFGAHFLSHRARKERPERPWENHRILCLSAYYPHKDFELIPSVAAKIRELAPDHAFQFLLTLPPGRPETQAILEQAHHLGVGDNVKNLGPVPLRDCPALYDDCDIAFVPSLLETSSATYPEALLMGLPIVTADLDFAREACGEGAAYFQPHEPNSAAAALASVMTDPLLAEDLRDRGRDELQRYPDPAAKNQMLVELIRSFASGHHRA